MPVAVAGCRHFYWLMPDPGIKNHGVLPQNPLLSKEPRPDKPGTCQAALLITLIRDAVTDDFRT